MVGEFAGKRFEIGTAFIQEQNYSESRNIEGNATFSIYAKIPAMDNNGGELVYLTTIHKSASKAEKFVNNLNS